MSLEVVGGGAVVGSRMEAGQRRNKREEGHMRDWTGAEYAVGVADSWVLGGCELRSGCLSNQGYC